MKNNYSINRPVGQRDPQDGLFMRFYTQKTPTGAVKKQMILFAPIHMTLTQNKTDHFYTIK